MRFCSFLWMSWRSHLLLIAWILLVVLLIALHHAFLAVVDSFHLLLHLLLSHLLLVSLHLRKLLLCVLLHLIRVHFLPVVVLDKLFLVVAAILAVGALIMLLLLVFVNFILQFDPIAADKNLIRLRYYLVANNTRLAIQTAQILDVTLQLVNHNVVELAKIVHVPVVIHGLVLAQVVLDQVDLK